MDVMEPQLLWIDGRCYRIIDGLTNRNISSYEEDKYEPLFENEETIAADIPIESCGRSRYKHSFHVAQAYFPYIVGSKCSILKRLEAETRTVIQIPRSGQNGDIVITGPNRETITTARHRIHLIIESSRGKFKPTHFLSIPLHENDISTTYELFRKDVLEKFGRDRGIDKEVFQETAKMHLTIGVLVLLDDEERERAIKTLERCKQEIIDPVLKQHGPIKILLKGIECMNDDPSEVRVLYAEIVEDGSLQTLVNDISEYFVKTGLLKDEQRETNRVKLHATIMNVRFKTKKDEDRNRYRKVNLTFDARNILKNYKDIVFGETYLKEIHLSQFHTVDENGYYQASAKINLC